MPRKKPIRVTLQLSQAMKLHRMFYPFHRIDKEVKYGETISRDALVREMLRDGLIRLKMAKKGFNARVLPRAQKPLSFIKIRATRLGRAKILANKLAHTGRFENLGKYFHVKGVERVRVGKQRTMKVQMQVALAYILDLMHDLAKDRAAIWKERNPGKELPANFSPVFRKDEILDALENEKLTRRDRAETSISLAEKKKRYERPPRYDDLHPDQRRFQMEREKIINFAIYMLQYRDNWSSAQKEFIELWKEYQTFYLHRRIGGKKE